MNDDMRFRWPFPETPRVVILDDPDKLSDAQIESLARALAVPPPMSSRVIVDSMREITKLALLPPPTGNRKERRRELALRRKKAQSKR